ncbi:MAG: hypothetical protein VB912_13060 [Pirellulaceae bacterium]
MSYQELLILLPCHSLEDFPVHHEGEDAQGLLAGWSALWHPQLLAQTQSILRWHRMDDPPEELAGRLVVIPKVSDQELPTGFVDRAGSEGATVVRNQLDRQQIVQAALDGLESRVSIPDDLVADFLALGYCHLQVELLTRQMRYASNLDEIHFQNLAVAAATAAVAGNPKLAQEKLTACFDLLAEERDHYYSVEVFLIDITMVNEATSGKRLEREVTGSTPTNCLLTAADVQRLADRQPATLTALKAALVTGQASVIGGEAGERALSLLSIESLRDELQRGRSIYEQLLDQPVRVYGRQRFGLNPNLPQLLKKFGFRGALHSTFEEGRFPEGSQVKTRWEGRDGSGLDALARVPLDANKPETFLSLATKLGESMDMDHVATICLAHWPGQVSPWYEDLRRIARYGSVLGKFVTLDTYFTETDASGLNDRFEMDQYRTPFLKQEIIRNQPDPISFWIRYWRHQAAADACQNLHTLAQLVEGKVDSSAEGFVDQVDCQSAGSEQTRLLPRNTQEESAAAVELVSGEEAQFTEAVSQMVQRFASAITPTQGPTAPRYQVTNPGSFARRIPVDVTQLSTLPAVEGPVYAAHEIKANGQTEASKWALVDVPPMGFVDLPAGSQAASSRAPGPSLVEDGILQNEFFQVVVHPESGGIQAIRGYESRDNRISQQLAYRSGKRRGRPGMMWDEKEEEKGYSRMVAEEVKTTCDNAIMGEITSKGQLLGAKGQQLARFQQRLRLWRGSRVLRLSIQIWPEQIPAADPWNSYYCSRFAWKNEGADLYRAVNQSRHKATAMQLEAPQYIDIDDGESCTSVLTGGLPFHRRIGFRMLDSLLVVRGETEQQFELGIGVDLPHPLQEAIGLMSPETAVFDPQGRPPTEKSAWLFHLNARNVMATAWKPWVEEGQIVGFQVRLLEVSGRRARLDLNSFRPISEAQQVDFEGASLGDCRTKEGSVQLELAPHEWIQLNARW